jgi:hypothetical protein
MPVAFGMSLLECVRVRCLRGLRSRPPSLQVLIRKVTPWARDRNARQRGVDWQFTMKDARIKLKRLYPQVQLP